MRKQNLVEEASISPYLQLNTERLVLSVVKNVNPEELLRYFTQNEAQWRQWLPQSDPSYFTLPYYREKLKQEVGQLINGTAIRFYLFLPHQPTQIIGDVHFSNIIYGAFQSCFLGYKVANIHSNQGYITEALKTAIPYLFSRLKLHRIEANIMPHNLASIKVVEKLGFYNEGLARKYLKINGIWQDHYHYVMLNPNEE